MWQFALLPSMAKWQIENGPHKEWYKELCDKRKAERMEKEAEKQKYLTNKIAKIVAKNKKKKCRY